MRKLKIVFWKRRNYKEKQELSFDEFKEKFKKDLDVAINDFIKSENKRTQYFPKFMKKEKDESSFYHSLQWNFNNYGKSEWFIERIK